MQAAHTPHPTLHTHTQVSVETFGCKLQQAQQVGAIERLMEFVPLKGKVSLRQADVTFWLVVSRTGGNTGVPDMPDRFYFGRAVAPCERSRRDTFALSKRAYIGPTSMDCEVAFIMANMGKVRPPHLSPTCSLFPILR